MSNLQKKFLMILVLINSLFSFTYPLDSAETNSSTGINNGNEGYIILNLNWTGKEIKVNNIKRVESPRKNGKKPRSHSFFYTVFSENERVVETGYFTIPKRMHYDFINELTGELEGGTIEREECDFVVRIPYYKNAKRILFFKNNQIHSFEHVKSLTNVKDMKEGELIGSIEF